MLSPEKQELFKRLWFSGSSNSEIAHALGIDVRMVSVYARVLKLPPRKKVVPPNKKLSDEDLERMKEMWISGATIKEIARHFGVSPYTVSLYLHAMGLKRWSRKPCVNIPAEELEKLCLEGYTDEEIAEMYNTSRNCIARLRKRYGINRRELTRQRRLEKMDRIVDTVARVLSESGFTTSIELRKKYGIEVGKDLLKYMESRIEGLRWFRLRNTATAKYTVFPSSFTVIYLKGHEKDVAVYLLGIAVKREVPLRSLRYLLKINGAPKEIIDFLNNL